MNGKRVHIALLSCFALTTACAEDEASDDPKAIRIGALTERTGTNPAELYEHAMSSASALMNEALAAEGSSIRFDVKIEDSQSRPDNAAAVVTRLVNEDGVKGVVSDNSGDTVAVAKLNYDPAGPLAYKVPITCYACSSAAINDPMAMNMDPIQQAALRDEENWLFRTFFNNKYESIVQLRIAGGLGTAGDTNGDGSVKLAVYAQDDPFGQSSAKAVMDYAEQVIPGATIEVKFVDPQIDVNSHPFGDDFDLLMNGHNETTDTADGEPDAVFLALLPLIGAGAVKAYRAASYAPPLLSVTALRRNYNLQILGPDAEGVEGNSPPLYVNNASGQAFVAAFSNSAPEMLCSGAYDSVVSLMLAALKASVNMTDPTQVSASEVREALATINDSAGEPIHATLEGFRKAFMTLKEGGAIDYEGASGAADYDAVGDSFPPLVHWKVENGQFVELEKYDCSPANPTCAPL